MGSVTLLKLTTIISLFLSIHSQTFFSTPEIEEDNAEYVLDAPFTGTHRRLGSRFLASTIKKGTKCNARKYNICNGVYANKGKSLLYCCKTHCRNIYGDRNNCGRCGNKCRQGELCCKGKCTNVGYNKYNCGKCGNSCGKGVKCSYGICGYA